MVAMIELQMVKSFYEVIWRTICHTLKFLNHVSTTIILKMNGRSATLNEPYQGYRNIILVEYWPTMYKWEVEICGSGKHIWVYSDEFTLD